MERAPRTPQRHTNASQRYVSRNRAKALADDLVRDRKHVSRAICAMFKHASSENIHDNIRVEMNGNNRFIHFGEVPPRAVGLMQEIVRWTPPHLSRVYPNATTRHHTIDTLRKMRLNIDFDRGVMVIMYGYRPENANRRAPGWVKFPFYNAETESPEWVFFLRHFILPAIDMGDFRHMQSSIKLWLQHGLIPMCDLSNAL
jgi:hypothetical protein